jgi:isopentenyl-diphosphate Delta-isomerase
MPKSRPSRTTPSRKRDHVALTLSRNVGFQGKTTGLEDWEFVHNALPELNIEDVDTSATFLDRPLSAPFMISCMTGGYAGAGRINRQLAEVCEDARIAMGVGSQRQALESREFHESFSIVRKAAPSIPIVGNLGAAEVAQLRSVEPVRRLVDLICADGFAVHLNPLQEFLQPEGTPKFRGVLDGIALLARELRVPIIVKEIGAGLSAATIRRLREVGVRYIDIAGAGGTSWAGVEILRRKRTPDPSRFWDWGIPTAEALTEAAVVRRNDPGFTIIASGGIGTGMDAAKCIGLGADLVSSARPMLTALHKRGTKGLQHQIEQWIFELRGTMFLTGSRTVRSLQSAAMAKRTRP